MNWSKALVAGLVGGVVNAVYEFIMHGLVMGNTYKSLPNVFRQDANPIWFTVIAILIGLAGALLFARTRGSWPAGAKGGMLFGVFVGLISFSACSTARSPCPTFPTISPGAWAASFSSSGCSSAPWWQASTKPDAGR
ncbi:MAG: hypothetical protein ONB48_01910 [candidate division KSB1 bacterium]|nr:hypothetical protein [candidate division KSB1 bacterium]MDZ7272566.1 hypothetical protein [candidate division KSB1 bacterium]MDZ7284411.1 hypothetical protein [candidate division KSB1 bacterium]MDZ7297193.1 hypothetical protein [candidate division KSB1 bacterium]MDZ7348060.1 hypothetical protein [candidate division KSB1 bacterium]